MHQTLLLLHLILCFFSVIWPSLSSIYWPWIVTPRIESIIDPRNPNIKLCWNEFYITNQNTPEKKKSFLETISNTADLDVIGLQDNFRADTSCQYIQDSLEEIAEVCRKCGKKIKI